MQEAVHPDAAIAERVGRVFEIFYFKNFFRAQTSFSIRPGARFAMKNVISNLHQTCKVLRDGGEFITRRRPRHIAY